MPNDDITHPVPDMTGYITEGQIVLGRELDHEGIYPPISVLPSLSRLMKDGIGEGHTRGDHSHWSSQLYAPMPMFRMYGRWPPSSAKRNCIAVDQQYLKFGRAFEHQFVNQAPTENRTIEQTLAIGWQLLGMLPQRRTDPRQPG